MVGIARKKIGRDIYFTAISDARFKQNLVSVNFMLPLSKKTAAANALLSMVLRRGCRDYPDMTAINRKLKDLYGARLDGGVVKRGEIQIVTFLCEMMSDGYALAGEKILSECAELLKSVIFDPALQDGLFRKEDVEVERRNLVDLIDSQLNDKRTYASHRLKEEMCAGEAYGVSEFGTREEAAGVTPEDLVEAWNGMMRRAGVEILFIGGGDAQACEALFEEAFRSVDRAETYRCRTQVVRSAEKVKTVMEKRPVTQAKLCMGFRAGVATPDKDVAAMQLACTILGGSPHSKLFANVREKLSLCYYCFSRFERQKGLVIIDSGIEEENYEKAKSEILRQTEEVKAGSFSDDEITFATLSLQNSYKELSDSLADLNAWYLGQIVAGNIRTPAQAAEEAASLTREDIVAAARKLSLDTVYLLAGNGEGANH